MTYESLVTRESAVRPGVSFTIRRMSLERRLDLTKRLRELLSRAEFLEAGKSPTETLDAAMLGTEVERTYLLWGLVELKGLEVDGQTATAESLAASGPEDLCREIAAAIKAESGLSPAERKN